MNVYDPVVLIVVLQVVVMVAAVDEFYVIDLGISVEKGKFVLKLHDLGI